MSGWGPSWVEVIEMLKVAAYVARDFLALLTLVAAAVALFAVVFKFRDLAARMIAGGSTAWVLALGSFLFPSRYAVPGRGFLFDSGVVLVMLAAALGLWIAVYVVWGIRVLRAR